MYYTERYDVTVTSINSGIWTSPQNRSLLIVRYWPLLRVETFFIEIKILATVDSGPKIHTRMPRAFKRAPTWHMKDPVHFPLPLQSTVRDVISFSLVWLWTEAFDTYEAKEMAPVLSVWLWLLPTPKPFRTEPFETVPALSVWLWVEPIVQIILSPRGRGHGGGNFFGFLYVSHNFKTEIFENFFLKIFPSPPVMQISTDAFELLLSSEPFGSQKPQLQSWKVPEPNWKSWNHFKWFGSERFQIWKSVRTKPKNRSSLDHIPICNKSVWNPDCIAAQQNCFGLLWKMDCITGHDSVTGRNGCPNKSKNE